MSTRSTALVDIADALDLIAEADRLDQAPSVGQRAFDTVAEQRSRGGAERGFEVGIRALLTTATTPQLLSTLQPQMPSAVQRRLFVRDLLPSLPADAGLIPFVRELNPLATEGGASAVAEGTVKPDAAGSILFDLRATAPVGTIVASLTASRQLLTDAPSFTGYVNSRLPYLLRVREEAIFLLGDGTDPSGIVGITRTPGVQAVTATVAGDLTSALVDGAGAVADVGGVADAIVCHPRDFLASYRASPQFWDSDSLPVLRVLSTSLPRGRAVVAEWATAATIYDRQTVGITVYNQHASLATVNEAFIVAEQRSALAVQIPGRFAAVSF